MFDDWLDILLRGNYEAVIPEIAIASEEVGKLTGSGQFSWNADSGIRIQATTDGGTTLSNLLFRPMPTPGRLIEHSTYLNISGRTQDNWEFSSVPIPRHGHHTHSDKPIVVWDLRTRGMTMRRQLTGLNDRGFRILIAPGLPLWTRETETEVRNEVFGGRVRHVDWLTTDCKIGRIAARRRTDTWFEVKVIPRDNEPLGDAFTIRSAIARAFSFILGRRCAIRGHEEIDENAEIRRIDAGGEETTENSLPIPIGRRRANADIREVRWRQRYARGLPRPVDSRALLGKLVRRVQSEAAGAAPVE